MPGFRKLAEREVVSTPLIQLASGTFVSPDGDEFQRDIVHHPGAVAVVPLLDDGTAVLVRQYRAAIDQDLLEIPAGKRDVADEPVEVTAARELTEEVGYRAGRLDLVARFYNSAGFSDELTWVFVARELESVGVDLQGVEERHMTVEHVALADVPGMIERGELSDAKTIIGLSVVLASGRSPRD